jgi:hypothetical protein
MPHAATENPPEVIERIAINVVKDFQRFPTPSAAGLVERADEFTRGELFISLSKRATVLADTWMP